MDLAKNLTKNSKEISKYLASVLRDDVKISNGRVYVWNEKTKLFDKSSEVDDAIINVVGGYVNDELSLLIDSISEERKKKKKSKIEELTDEDVRKRIVEIEKLQRTFTKTSTIKQLMPYLKNEFKDEAFYNIIDGKRDVVNYKNGVLSLISGKFRVRTKIDAFSSCLPYDYTTQRDETIKAHTLKILYEICNDDNELLEFVLMWLGYCITGEVKEQKLMCYLGKLASNGKSTIMQIFSKVFPTYIMKAENSMIQYGSQDKHKSLIECEKPIRVVFVEEVDSKKLDPSFLKDFSGGEKMACKLMYSTIANIVIHAKICMTINGIPRFENDNGIERRLLAIEFCNQFYPKDHVKHKKNTKGHYVANTNILGLFECDAYRVEFMGILLDYTKTYYKKGLIIPNFIQVQGAEICSLNDNMNTFINDRFEITKDGNDIIGKDHFINLYHDAFNCKTPWINVLADAKRCNLVYDKEKRYNGIKGCFIGLKLNEDENKHIKKDVFEMVDVKNNIALQTDPYENGVIQCDYKVEVNTKPTKPTIKKKLNKETLGVDIISDLL